MLGWIIFAVFAVMGVLFWTGKGGWLIAGYNTASAEEKKKYDEETARLEQRLQELQSRQEIQQENHQQIERNISQLKCYADQMELTEEIKEKLIDKVKVYSDNRIEICWKFDSGFLDTQTMHKCG